MKVYEYKELREGRARLIPALCKAGVDEWRLSHTVIDPATREYICILEREILIDNGGS